MSIYDENTKGLFATLENGTGYGSTYDNNILNPHVNFHNHKGSQTLGDMLVAEAIQMRGVRCIYIRRTLVDVDLVFGEDPRSKFNDHFNISAYIDSFDGWDGDGDWMSKFGFTVSDEMNLSLNPKLFAHQTDGGEAKEGDLIYFPAANSLFELTWVEKEDPWYGVGHLPMRKCRAQKFVYSGEEIKLQKSDEYIDSIDDLFTVVSAEDEDVDKINALDGRWDTMVIEGQEHDQIQDEASVFTQKQTQIPPVKPKESGAMSLGIDLDDMNF